MIRLLLQRLLSIAVACTALAACIPPSFARLDDILVDSRPAQADEFGRVRITRAGATRDGAPGMAILKGDTVTTAADGVAAVTLTAGWEVIFEPGTVAQIENPSIFLKIGKLIIKKLQEVKEALTVNNEFVSAGAEGTVFVFEVTRDGEVKIEVLEGRVVVRSPLGRWDSVPYQAGDAGMARVGVPPTKRRLDPQALRNIRQRVTVIDQAKRLRVPIDRVVVPVAPAPPPSSPTAATPIEGAAMAPAGAVRVAARCTVPKLIERTEDAVKEALAAANLQVGKVSRLESGRLVTKQSPAAGATVACGSAVDYVVGTSRD